MTETAVLAAASGKRKAALGFIFVTALIDVMSLGLIIPVLPKLVESFEGGDTARAAEMLGLFGTAWALMQFVFSPILGMLSDQFGRRPVILVSVFGLGIDYVLMAISPSLTWLFIGRLISGITAASFTAASAYIADITPPAERARSFGLIGAAWGVGFVLGPALGGILGAYGPRWPFWAAAALALLNWLYGLLILPESLPPERRVQFSWEKANPAGSLTLLRSRPELLGLAGVNFLYMLAHNVLPSVFVLYTGFRYGWTAFDVGLMLAATGVANILIQAVLVGPAVRYLGERGALLAGLAAGATGFAIYGLAPESAVFWTGIPVFAFMGLVQPGAQALMTRLAGASEQGQLQGANSSIMGLTGILGPGLFTLVFAWSIRGGQAHALPGLAVLIAAAMMAAALVLAARVTRNMRNSAGDSRH
jgi:DHA1 family tetracycline resistance protein-like MFS transporter